MSLPSNAGSDAGGQPCIDAGFPVEFLSDGQVTGSEARRIDERVTGRPASVMTKRLGLAAEFADRLELGPHL